VYSERGINDNNKGVSAGFAGHGNQCPGCERLFDRGDQRPEGYYGETAFGYTDYPFLKSEQSPRREK
jgi:hypothetical protein